MADRTYNSKGELTSSHTGASKSSDDIAAAAYKEKIDPTMKKPDSSSFNPPKGGLGAVAAANAKKKKVGSTAQADALDRAYKN